MIFHPLKLEGSYLIELDKKKDSRGFFARTFCVNEFKEMGLVSNFIQMSTSFNYQSGQMRGMHYQDDPFQETKIVRCISGELIDIILDLRVNSKTYMQWHVEVLSACNRKMLYIPKGFAHGYKTLSDNCEIFYMMDQEYSVNHSKELPFPEDLPI